MSALVALAIVIAGAAGAIVRALLIDQVRGQIQRYLTQSIESTIASLPDDLQTEWGEEWRAELAACIEMPVTAARFARGLRARAHNLVDDLAPVPTQASSHRGRRWRLPRVVGVRRTLQRVFLPGRERVVARIDMSVVALVAAFIVAFVAAFVGFVFGLVAGDLVAFVGFAAIVVGLVAGGVVVFVRLR